MTGAGVAAGVEAGATTTVPGGAFKPQALQLDAVFLLTHSHFEHTHNSAGTSGAEAATSDGWYAYAAGGADAEAGGGYAYAAGGADAVTGGW
jgi:hypothetical protein